MKKIVFDARMITYSGIGRYIQNILPLLLDSDQFETVLLGRFSEISFFFHGVAYQQVIETHVPIYSPFEHIVLPFIIPPCDIFFSPHYVTPFFKIKAKKRITVIHDLFHIWEDSHFKGLKKVYARALLANALRTSDSLVTISRFQRDEIRRCFPKYKNDVDIIYHGVTLDLFKQENRGERKLQNPYILYVGNIKPHKNLIRLLKAFKRINIPELRLVIVGTEKGFHSPEDNLDSHIDTLGERVFFTGYVEDQDLISWYAHAEFLVHPSIYEGFGITPLEALALDVPILISEIPVLKEVYRDAAMYCDPYDIGDIASKIEQLYFDKNMQQKIVQVGHGIIDFYTMETFFNKYRDLLNSL